MVLNQIAMPKKLNKNPNINKINWQEDKTEKILTNNITYEDIIIVYKLLLKFKGKETKCL